MQSDIKKIIEKLIKQELNIVNIRQNPNFEEEFDFCFYPINELKTQNISSAINSGMEQAFLLGQIYIYIEMIHQWIEEHRTEKTTFDLIWKQLPEINDKRAIDCKFYLIEHKK
jgi:hypothetical protein